MTISRFTLSPLPHLSNRRRIPGPIALLLVLATIAGGLAFGAEPATDREAVAFVQEILSRRPAKEMSIHGVLNHRQSDGKRIRTPIDYSVRLLDETWQSIYQTGGAETGAAEKLVVIHHLDEPNRYSLTRISANGSTTNSLHLTGSEASVAFAKSDFWLSDLGLEFLHWPQQRFVRDAKITMRWGRPCKVLESTNPRPTDGNYAKVVSWVDSELGSVIQAEAYDSQGKRSKIFLLKKFGKVDGRWQVKDMEILDEKSDSRTRLEFDFETE